MEEPSAQVARLVLQVGVILLAAKAGGELFERYLKQPAVLGELAAGMLIGPYALGGLSLGGLGPLFSNSGLESLGLPVSQDLYTLAQIGAVVLLFVVGLETDLPLFFRYLGPAAAVATGGVVLPFFLGVYATVAFGLVDSPLSAEALFMGAILTATSVGITARVLRDRGKLATPEGVTVIASAVIDDVLGILVLTIVIGISNSGQISAQEIGWVTVKAVGFWVALTGAALLLARPIARLLGALQVPGAAVAAALALAFLAAALAEGAGLAMVIGAYSVGLALSYTDLAKALHAPLNAVYHVLVPLFFAVTGMMVDFQAMGGGLLFSLVIVLLALAGKFLGAALPSLATGFTPWGALRIGVGMVPRGEIALIIAATALTRGVISTDIYGVAVLMTVVTTVLATTLLRPAFERGGMGSRARTATARPGSVA